FIPDLQGESFPEFCGFCKPECSCYIIEVRRHLKEVKINNMIHGFKKLPEILPDFKGTLTELAPVGYGSMHLYAPPESCPFRAPDFNLPGKRKSIEAGVKFDTVQAGILYKPIKVLLFVPIVVPAARTYKHIHTFPFGYPA